MAEIDAVSPTPDTQPFNVENGQIAGQSQNERFSVVAPKRVDFPILVRHLMALLAGLGTRTHPEECVYRISIMMGTECKFFFLSFSLPHSTRPAQREVHCPYLERLRRK